MNQLKGLAASGLALMLALTPATASSVYAQTPERVQQLTETTEPGETHEKHAHPPFRHFRGGHIVKDTAELLGMEPKSVFEQLKQGKTLLQVVQNAKGWSEGEYIKKLTETASVNIDKAVAEGKIDSEKAAKIKAALPDKLKVIIHRTWKQEKPGHPAMDQPHNQINWLHQH